MFHTDPDPQIWICEYGRPNNHRIGRIRIISGHFRAHWNKCCQEKVDTIFKRTRNQFFDNWFIQKFIPVFDKIVRIRIRTSNSNPSIRITDPRGQIITDPPDPGKMKTRASKPYQNDFLPWLRRRCSLPSLTWRSEHIIIENITKHVEIS